MGGRAGGWGENVFEGWVVAAAGGQLGEAQSGCRQLAPLMLAAARCCLWQHCGHPSGACCTRLQSPYTLSMHCMAWLQVGRVRGAAGAAPAHRAPDEHGAELLPARIRGVQARSQRRRHRAPKPRRCPRSSSSEHPGARQLPPKPPAPGPGLLDPLLEGSHRPLRLLQHRPRHPPLRQHWLQTHAPTTSSGSLEAWQFNSSSNLAPQAGKHTRASP